MPRSSRKGFRGRSYHGRTMKPRKTNQKKSLFFPARHEKYARIIRIDNPDHAVESVVMLKREFDSAKTHQKRVRIKRVVVLTINRINAMLKKKNLSQRERKELRKIKRMYKALLSRITNT